MMSVTRLPAGAVARRARLLIAVPAGVLLTAMPRAVMADDPCSGVPDPGAAIGCAAANGLANAAGAAAQFGADAAERALTKWVVDAAVWLLQQLGDVVFHTASPALSADW